MKSFKFHKQNTPFVVLYLAVAVVFIFLSTFEIIEKGNTLTNSLLKLIGYIMVVIHFIKTLYHKVYVSYDTKNVTIRFNRNILKERSYQFKHLKDVKRKEATIFLTYRKLPEQIDLSGFTEASISRLFTILSHANK